MGSQVAGKSGYLTIEGEIEKELILGKFRDGIVDLREGDIGKLAPVGKRLKFFHHGNRNSQYFAHFSERGFSSVADHLRG